MINVKISFNDTNQDQDLDQGLPVVKILFNTVCNSVLTDNYVFCSCKKVQRTFLKFNLNWIFIQITVFLAWIQIKQCSEYGSGADPDTKPWKRICCVSSTFMNSRYSCQFLSCARSSGFTWKYGRLICSSNRHLQSIRVAKKK